MAAAAGTLEQRILAFVTQCADGASLDDIIGGVQGGAPPKERLVEVLNGMLAGHSLSLLKGPGNQLRYRAAGAREQRARGLGAEEVMVLQHIQRAGSAGAWTRDLKARTNLGQPQITKILKALEARGLTKAVKSVANPSRKLVMLAELEPSKEVTGGAWYTASQQFDAGFIDAVRGALLRYLRTNGEGRVSQIAAWLFGSGLLTGDAKVTRDDVRQVLESLAFEGVLDAFEGDNGDDRYRLAEAKFPATTALTSLPCGVCPVADQCRDGGPISPQTCAYMDKWLEF